MRHLMSLHYSSLFCFFSCLAYTSLVLMRVKEENKCENENTNENYENCGCKSFI